MTCTWTFQDRLLGLRMRSPLFWWLDASKTTELLLQGQQQNLEPLLLQTRMETFFLRCLLFLSGMNRGVDFHAFMGPTLCAIDHQSMKKKSIPMVLKYDSRRRVSRVRFPGSDFDWQLSAGDVRECIEWRLKRNIQKQTWRVLSLCPPSSPLMAAWVTKVDH